MRYIAAYLLLQLGGKAEPTAADIERVLGSVGVAVDRDRLQQLLTSLEGKNIAHIIEEGSKKLAVVPMDAAVTHKPPGAQESPPVEDPGKDEGAEVRLGFVAMIYGADRL